MNVLADFAVARSVRHNLGVRWQAAVAWCLAAACAAASAAPESGPPAEAAPPERDAAQWIERVRAAPCVRPYTGTFVVLSASGAMTSSRIWHACEGRQPVERVDTLSGTPRTVFRRSDEVRTFLPQARLVRTDQRDVAGIFPRVATVSGAAIAQYYATRFVGQERIAGHVADVVWFKPQDGLRFGYRLWSERDTGLVVKLQTLAADGRVLEQAAFSELDLNAGIKAAQLSRMMDATEGFKVVSAPAVKTTARAEGWSLRQPVPGFLPVNCHRRAVSPDAEGPHVLQCLYSDGLATVSLFFEPYDAARHPAQPQASTMGATQLLAQRVAADVWVTAVGEVPLQTLKLFAGELERVR